MRADACAEYVMDLRGNNPLCEFNWAVFSKVGKERRNVIGAREHHQP